MDTPCEHLGDLYDPESRLRESRYRDSSEAFASLPSALACGCRQDGHRHPDHPRNRDADAVGIVMTGMSSRLRLRMARINLSVLRDVIMVTDVTETSG